MRVTEAGGPLTGKTAPAKKDAARLPTTAADAELGALRTERGERDEAEGEREGEARDRAHESAGEIAAEELEGKPHGPWDLSGMTDEPWDGGAILPSPRLQSA